ncbi:hypothetical protein [Sporolactobacillus laevolacticus]|uniref:Uncharacterized protein n=1 Tax=Sporolactobacillus laevolacticus DSM 442 TaxID=1395513 RepID=V6IXI6_9BACL|nr:hypothetical protein [Sporolactobacillus laevolacticus]EST12062.1 hypothetical protein P343_08080 [Sporolactobacillus laevolacticus DSM 442]
MPSKYHKQLVQIGKLLDESAVIRSKDRMGKEDFEQLKLIDLQLRELGKSIDSTMGETKETEKIKQLEEWLNYLKRQFNSERVASNGRKSKASDVEIAMALDRGKGINYIKNHLFVGAKRIKEVKEKLKKIKATRYAIYKGDRLICTGTAVECADKLNCRPDYISWLTTPTAKKRLANRKHPERAIVGFRIEGGLENAE